MLQVAREILANPQDKTKITLVYGNVSEQDIIERSTLDTLAQAHPDRFTLKYIVDKATSSNWPGLTGHITADVIKSYMPAPTDEVINQEREQKSHYNLNALLHSNRRAACWFVVLHPWLPQLLDQRHPITLKASLLELCLPSDIRRRMSSSTNH